MSKTPLQRPDDEIIPDYNGQRKTLSPDEVDRLRTLGYKVTEQKAFAELSNGRRWHMVWDGEGNHAT
jgi:hypothetical protein